jgi:hypothetical protein
LTANGVKTKIRTAQGGKGGNGTRMFPSAPRYVLSWRSFARRSGRIARPRFGWPTCRAIAKRRRTGRMRGVGRKQDLRRGKRGAVPVAFRFRFSAPFARISVHLLAKAFGACSRKRSEPARESFRSSRLNLPAPPFRSRFPASPLPRFPLFDLNIDQ